MSGKSWKCTLILAFYWLTQGGIERSQAQIELSTPGMLPPIPAVAERNSAAEQPSSTKKAGIQLPVAVAGDDQIGLVGRQITLNGSKSRPENLVGFRWMHISGPLIANATQDGAFFSFIPTQPGIYRFALCVGLENQVSHPSIVVVEVGQRPTPPPAELAPTPAIPTRAVPNTAPSASPTPTESPIVKWAATALTAIPNHMETSAKVSEVFQNIADRVNLYSNFSQLQTELNRRLEVAVPTDPATRSLWSTHIFGPLAQTTAMELIACGIDLRVPEAGEKSFEPWQRDRLVAFYSTLATAFKSKSGKL